MSGDDQSRVDRIKRRKLLSCSFCKPHRNENAGRQAKHGVKKPRYKDKRG